MASSLDKIHCMAQLTDFSQENRADKDSPSCRVVTHDVLPLKWMGLTSGRKMRFYKCESSAPASAFYVT
ncbi:hypothetical protein DV515_00007216 [Chloebia gouldiae]|uniref:Uncharacterized protein n=1 Tax=Chloebia gouldiae TaxID=44316 RepID=A0A3L8SJ16_CHLGU|nr:hypothetical protein DV515_00007216 [Chloebia gouldiae]